MHEHDLIFDPEAPDLWAGDFDLFWDAAFFGTPEESVSTVTYDRSAFWDEIFDAYNDADIPNWNGYGAQAAHVGSLTYACRIVTALPVDVPSPQAEITPLGTVYLYWRGPKRHTLMLDVEPDGRLVYTTLIGEEKPRGIAYGTEGLPEGLLGLLRRVLG